MKYACPNPNCRKLGCYDHCNTCGKDIVWRPPNLDREIAYKHSGPPFNPDGTIHNGCKRDGTATVKGYVNTSGSTTYSKELYHYLKHGYPKPVYYYTEQDVETMKDPVIKAEWERQRRE